MTPTCPECGSTKIIEQTPGSWTFDMNGWFNTVSLKCAMGHIWKYRISGDQTPKKQKRMFD